MSSGFDDVGEFHRKFELPHLGDGRLPHLPAPDVWEFRRKFLLEELREADEAYRAGDLVKFFDALIDLNYVAYGTAHLAALPWAQGWAEVQRANLAKERAASAADVRSTRGHALDVVKPVGWTPPAIDRVLTDWVELLNRNR